MRVSHMKMLPKRRSMLVTKVNTTEKKEKQKKEERSVVDVSYYNAPNLRPSVRLSVCPTPFNSETVADMEKF